MKKDMKYTLVIKGNPVVLTKDELMDVLKQAEKISDREDIRNTLDCCNAVYTEKMLDHLAQNLRHELWSDSSFSFAYDDVVLHMADRYVSDIRRRAASADAQEGIAEEARELSEYEFSYPEEDPKDDDEAVSAQDTKELRKTASLLWQNRDEEGGHSCEYGADLWTLTKGSELIRLDRENVPEEDIYPYDPDAYYLDRNSIYVYRVAGESNIIKVLEGNGSSFFEFC